MTRRSDLKLIDLLSLRPGSLLHVHTVKGEAACLQAEIFSRSEGWKRDITDAVFPEGDLLRKHNLLKLLEIPIDAQVIVRHPESKVVEILRLEASMWSDLLSRAGQQADLMVGGRVLAHGEIVNTASESGIRITEIIE
ncbi:MAG: FliM/FliN family flagellar motor switch protein [Candidatus Omnitrophota bacterium]